MSTEEQIEKAISFLEDCNKSIEDFPTKLGTHLRTATISHLRNPVNGRLLYGEAATLIDEWLERNKEE